MWCSRAATPHQFAARQGSERLTASLEQAHREVEHIFRDLLPQGGLSVREGQVALCHTMVDALFQNKIALCDAGVGIGKTYAYLTAAVLLKKYRPFDRRPVVVSTSTVALQEAITREYLPFLSRILLGSQVIAEPIRFAVRKGKGRYVCDLRLLRRLAAVEDKPKNPLQRAALDSLRKLVDLDSVPHLSGFDRRQVCVPPVCLEDCPQRLFCRYWKTRERAGDAAVFIQICNHNYLLADAAHRQNGLRPLLGDYRALLIDEAHKLPEAARQMYGESLAQGELLDLCKALGREGFLSAAQRLRAQVPTLWDTIQRCENDLDAPRVAFRLTPPRRAALRGCLSLLENLPAQLGCRLPRYLAHRLGRTAATLALFLNTSKSRILTLEYDREGNPTLQAHSRETPRQLRQALWERDLPVLLTSGTLAAGGNFHRAKALLGLESESRVTASVTPSPFPYEKNCLLYLPSAPSVSMGGWREVNYLSEQILSLVEATHGHTLVLFTSYKLMGAVYRQVKDRLGFPLFEVWRNGSAAIRQFKEAENGVLFAAGSCWEGVDFPGDMVSSLILPRLPFPVPDPLRQAEQARYPSLEDYLREVILPDMQVKLRQGFGRAIRSETDTCVVSLLDHRAAPGGRYHQAALEALPKIPVTGELAGVAEFIRENKNGEYFAQEGAPYANPL